MSPEAPEKVDRRRGPRKPAMDSETERKLDALESGAVDEVAELRAQLEELRAQLAEKTAQQTEDTADEITEVAPDEDGAKTINFVEDGMTWLGQVWFRGQELTVKPGTKEWKELTDPKTGKLLLDLDENEQIIRWGKRMFRPGRWAGEGFDLSDPNLSDEERARLASIQQKRAQMGLAPGAPQKRRLFNS